MTLSQEILVLDFGDEKQSQYLKNNEALFSEFGKGNLSFLSLACSHIYMLCS